MYKKILIPLENSSTDKAILDHIQSFSGKTKAHLVLVHVADGWAARNFKVLNLNESDEIKSDKSYLEAQAEGLKARGFEVSFVLAMGEPADEIAAVAKAQNADLIAMATHGHRFFADLFFGSTADRLRHLVDIPVLMIRGGKPRA